MPRKKTKEEFELDLFKKRGSEYKLISDYYGNSIKSEFLHEKCQRLFKMTPNSILISQNCPICIGKVRTTEMVRSDILNWVGSEYELLNEYVDSRTPLKILHVPCGKIITPIYNEFRKGRRCRCNRRKSDEEFRQTVFNLTGDEYIFLDNYVKSSQKIKVLHTTCNRTYLVTPSDFLSGCRCSHCFIKRRKTTECFKSELNSLVGDEYILISDYINNSTKVKMIHNVCGNEYDVAPLDFLRGNRCPRCRESRGEKVIYEYLRSFNNIEFNRQYWFDDCRNKRPLRFDFMVIYNKIMILIEFDGRQHYVGFRGNKRFDETIINDKIKNEYCANNNIPLLRIPFWQIEYIHNILDDFFEKFNDYPLIGVHTSVWKRETPNEISEKI